MRRALFAGAAAIVSSACALHPVEDASDGSAGADVSVEADAHISADAQANADQDGGDATTEPTTPPGAICSGQWCWENPLPQGLDLGLVEALSPTDVWALPTGKWGDYRLFHFDGSIWTASPSPAKLSILAAWGHPSGDLWLLMEQDVPGPDFSTQVMHWNGSCWQDAALTVPGSFSLVTGTSPNDVWIGGFRIPAGAEAGTDWKAVIAHFDGKQWTDASPDQGRFVGSMSATPSGAIWASVEAIDSTTDAVMAYDAGGWSVVPDLPAMGNMLALSPDVVVGSAWSESPGLMRIVRWDGTQLTTLLDLLPTPIKALWGPNESNLWVTSGKEASEERLWHYDGTAWSDIADPLMYSTAAIRGSSADDVWLVGSAGGMAHNDGTGWTSNTNFVVPPGELERISGSGSNDVWGVGSGVAYHYDGTSWTQQDVGGKVKGVWSSGPNDAWAVGDKIWHSDGTTWGQVKGAPSGVFNAVHASGPQDVWVVGSAVAHFDGAGWEVLDQPVLVGYGGAGKTNVLDVWVAGPNDAWMTGWTSTLSGDSSEIALYHHLGSSVTMEFVGAERVRGSSADNIWALGYGAWRYDGKTWTLMKQEQVHAAWSDGPDNAWLQGPVGVEHFDGKTWTPEWLDGFYPADLWGSPDGVLRAVGRNGAIMRRW